MKIQAPTGEEPPARMGQCPECGEPVELDDGTNTYCPKHMRQVRRTRERASGRASSTDRGYGGKWRRLSKRARGRQDFCSDCGATDDLTADHSTRAWQAHDRGEVITLEMIDVVCRRCNTERGAARGPTATDDYRLNHAEQFARISADFDD